MCSIFILTPDPPGSEQNLEFSPSSCWVWDVTDCSWQKCLQLEFAIVHWSTDVLVLWELLFVLNFLLPHLLTVSLVLLHSVRKLPA